MQNKRKPKRKPQETANTAGEAIEKLLKEKKISSKINYDVLKNLEKPTTDVVRPTAEAALPLDPSPLKRETVISPGIKAERVISTGIKAERESTKRAITEVIEEDGVSYFCQSYC